MRQGRESRRQTSLQLSARLHSRRQVLQGVRGEARPTGGQLRAAQVPLQLLRALQRCCCRLHEIAEDITWSSMHFNDVSADAPTCRCRRLQLQHA